MTQRLLCWLSILVFITVLTAHAGTVPAPRKRIALIVDSWYPVSHADVIGTRFLEGYRVGEKAYASPLTVASVFADTPRPNDSTRALSVRYGFRIATSVADALLEDVGSPTPRLAVDGVLIATREDVPGSGQRQSATTRLQIMREILQIFDRTGTRVPIFLDKMLAAQWQDAEAIVTETRRRGIPLMAGSVLGYLPLDRPVQTGRLNVAVVAASTPYWAFAFHAAELLQSYMEQRATHETGIREIREVGPAYWSMPDRNRWGGSVLDALLASARTRERHPVASYAPEAHVLLIQYLDGARAVLVLIPRVFSDSEFLLGAQLADGTTGIGGVVLPRAPYDHFGYLVHALAELYTAGRPPIPAERALLTTGLVLFGQRALQTGSVVATSSLGISYASPRSRP